MEYAIQTEGITKSFGKHKAVDNVSLHVKRGEIYGFIGKNGAGKTTFMKMISGLSNPTSGELILFGESGSNIENQRKRIGNLIEEPGIYAKMTGYQNLMCKALALGIHNKEYIQELLDVVGLGNVGKKKVKNYSLGMKQRLGIAMALVGGPDLLVLDEPTNGLDPQGIAEVRNTIRKLQEEKNMTIMISSHILEELYKVADTFGIINDGKLLQELSKEELSAKCRDYLEIKVDYAAKACPILEEMQITNYKVIGNDTIHIYEKIDHAGTINTKLLQHGISISHLSIMNEKLEDYFLNLVGGDNLG